MENINIDKIKTISEVEKYRNQINEACDKRISFIKRCLEACEISNGGFLSLKENMENMSHLLFTTKDGQSIIKRYISAINSSNELKTMHIISENIRKADSSTDVDFVINSIVGEKWGIDRVKLSEDIEMLADIVAEGYILLGEEYKKDFNISSDRLNEAITFIATSNKSKSNITEYGNAIKVIKENISSKKEKVSENRISEFKEKYAELLSNEELDFVNEVASSKNDNELFEKYKNICNEKVDNNIRTSNSESEINKLTEIKNKISEKKFSKETFVDDICAFSEIYKILNS